MPVSLFLSFSSFKLKRKQIKSEKKIKLIVVKYFEIQAPISIQGVFSDFIKIYHIAHTESSEKLIQFLTKVDCQSTRPGLLYSFASLCTFLSSLNNSEEGVPPLFLGSSL